MRRYAAHTTVPVAKSMMEVQRVLTLYGATRFGTMVAPDKATVYCELKGRQVQIDVPLPHTGDSKWKYASANKMDQEKRRRWRVLLITVKSMLESVESGLLTFDQAFLSFVVIPGTAQTIGAFLIPKLNALYQGQSLRALLSENPESPA